MLMMCSCLFLASADGPARFVGYIRLPVKQTEKQETGVTIFYLSTIGLLSKHSCSLFDARKLMLVKEASEEAQIVRIWRQRKSYFPARFWDSRETYLEDGRCDILDLARSP